MSEYDNYTYVVSVRETVDTQYIVRVPNELSPEAIESMKMSPLVADFLTQESESRFSRNVREREVVDVTFTGCQLKT
jgi:hypothetical protein